MEAVPFCDDLLPEILLAVNHQQLVLTGPQEEIERAFLLFSALPKVSFVKLNVSGAFHSPLMSTAQQAFEVFLMPMTFETPQLPVISNVDARPYHPANVKSNLIAQLVQPVQWTKIIDYLQIKPNFLFKEVGPGNVLKGLIRRIQNFQ